VLIHSPEEQKQEAPAENKKVSPLALTLGIVGAILVAVVVIAGVAYHVHRKKMEAMRSVSPLPDAPMAWQ